MDIANNNSKHNGGKQTATRKTAVQEKYMNGHFWAYKINRHEIKQKPKQKLLKEKDSSGSSLPYAIASNYRLYIAKENKVQWIKKHTKVAEECFVEKEEEDDDDLD